MSEQATEQTETEEPPAAPAKGKGYHVSDLPEGAKPDPLGDASLSAVERATAKGDD